MGGFVAPYCLPPPPQKKEKQRRKKGTRGGVGELFPLTVAFRQFPGSHTTGREWRHLVREGNAANANHVGLVAWVVQRAVKWAVVSNGRDHYNPVRGQLVHLK